MTEVPTHIYAVHHSQLNRWQRIRELSFNTMWKNKYTIKTTGTVMQTTLPYSRFNVFLHPHVHRWPSIGEKICLWICLTRLECNCILIWAQGQTSVHSAAVKRPLHSVLFIQLSLLHTTNLYSGGEMLPITGQTASWTIMCHCSTSSAYIAIFKRTFISGANKPAASGPQPLRTRKVCSKETI